jgi:prepilin-type N-terminal cleavage/methylation domain-containing protein
MNRPKGKKINQNEELNTIWNIWWIRRGRKMNKKGFTLIELTITMFILGFVLLAMGTHIGLVMKTTVKDKRITAATSLLQDKMEGLKKVDYTSISNGSDSASAIGATYTRNWNVTSISNNMKQVQVTVTWQGGTLSGSTVISQ